MRTNKSLCIDIGIMPREIASHELTVGGSVQIASRPVPYTRSNITWITHPYDTRKTYAQINVQSSDEARILRLCRKWGWKIVNLQRPLGQNIGEEKGINFERTNEIIRNWSFK
jgi:hypothetical protein